jgi:2-polyprenyl-3-methyl-5-hydroxy-6-metoxy-1,4-benzoquinol methylase
MPGITAIFSRIQPFFPFPGYMIEAKIPKYRLIATKIHESCPDGAKVLSIGAGPCDLEAILSGMGYRVTGIDDLSDHWHCIGKNRERITAFAEKMNIRLVTDTEDIARLEPGSFDAVILVDILEHLHGSPRGFLNNAISLIRPGGLVLIEVPNTVNLKNRISVLLGKSSQTDMDYIFWNIGEYRSHVREYTRSELFSVLQSMGLEKIEIDPRNLMTGILADTAESIGRKSAIFIYGTISGIYPNFRDTLVATAKKPAAWEPVKDSLDEFRRCYTLVKECNLDSVSDDDLVQQIGKKGG